MTDAKRAEEVTRDTILGLLSDEETATVALPLQRPTTSHHCLGNREAHCALRCARAGDTFSIGPKASATRRAVLGPTCRNGLHHVLYCSTPARIQLYGRINPEQHNSG
jgi:hypothetical protein